VVDEVDVPLVELEVYGTYVGLNVGWLEDVDKTKDEDDEDTGRGHRSNAGLINELTVVFPIIGPGASATTLTSKRQ
jgi:hypothetical protein